MHGNVWEWVQDCFDAAAYSGKAPSDGRAFEEAGCSERVIRGGSWLYGAPGLRSAERNSFMAEDRNEVIGFRLVLSLP